MTERRSAAVTGAGLHTGSSGKAATASPSTARKTGAGKPSSSLRECLSRTGSGMRTSTAPGSGPPRSLHMRLEKGDLSEVCPRRTNADDVAVGKRDGGGQRRGPVPAEPYGECDGGEGGGDAVDGGDGVEALHQVAPPLGGDGVGARQLVRGNALLSGQPVQPGGGEVIALGLGKEDGGVGDRGAEPAGLQLIDGLVDRALRPAGDGDDLGPVEEGHRRQGAEDLGLTSCGPHSCASSSASPVSFSSPAARSWNSRTFFQAGASVKEMSRSDRV